jgi:cGMP-dependent protein kinase
MDDYVIKRTLGVGAFGFVKLVQWKKAPKGDEDQWYALKCVSKQKIEQHKQQEKIKREEDIMKELVHPFIARLYSGMEDEKGSRVFQAVKTLINFFFFWKKSFDVASGHWKSW